MSQSSNFQNARNFRIGRLNYNVNNIGERSPKSSIEKLREHISPGALHNSAERSDAPKCHPETRVAVQGEMVSWISIGNRDHEPKEIMWMTGPAGSGKTAIMGSVSKTCQKDGTLVGTFFFSSFSGSADRRSKRCLVPTLAYQIVQHKAMSQVSEQILSAVERNPVVFEQNLEVQLEELILEPLRACRDRADQSEWPKVFLIDGLDECEADQYHDPSRSKAPLRSKERDQTEILFMLKKAADDPDFPFRIIIASRPEPAIRSFFTDIAKSMTRELFLDEKYKPDADMALFLESKFAKIRRRRQLPPSWPGEAAPRKLTGNASGQFIYVATVGRFIEETAGDPNQLLNQVLRLPGFKSSTNPFAPLDALYTHIINPTGNPADSRTIILWLNTLFREKYLDTAHYGGQPPKAKFARHFLESYFGEASDVFKNLNSLVAFETQYTLYHKSLVDFLESEGRSGNLYIDPETVKAFFIDCYLKIWQNKGPQRGLNSDQERLEFLETLSREATVRFFRSVGNWDHIAATVLGCDVLWISQHIPQKHQQFYSIHSEITVNEICELIHNKTCAWWCHKVCQHVSKMKVESPDMLHAKTEWRKTPRRRFR